MRNHVGKFSVITITSFIWALILKFIIKFMSKIINHAKRRDNRFRIYHLLENKWLLLKNQGHSLNEYFKKYNIKNIAIYNMDDTSERLIEELNQDNFVNINYIIDENAYRKCTNYKIVDFNDYWEKVDAIVVTNDFDFNEIKEKINKKIHNELLILSLKDIILECTKI